MTHIVERVIYAVGHGFYYETFDEELVNVEQVDESGDHDGASQLRSTVRILLMASAPCFDSDDKTNKKVIVKDAT